MAKEAMAFRALVGLAVLGLLGLAVKEAPSMMRELNIWRM